MSRSVNALHLEPFEPLRPQSHVEESTDAGSSRDWSNQMEKLRRKINALLNKISPGNLKTIVEQLAQLVPKREEELDFMVKIIVEKVLAGPHWCETYADMSLALRSGYPEFTRILLEICQMEFANIPISFEPTQEEKASMDQEALCALKKKKKDNMLANMKFIGHLFLRRMVAIQAIVRCVDELIGLQKSPLPAEHKIDCVCELLQVVGQEVDRRECGKMFMSRFMDRLMDLKLAVGCDEKAFFSKRVQFQIRNLLDLRQSGWQKEKLVEPAKNTADVQPRHGTKATTQIAGKRLACIDNFNNEVAMSRWQGISQDLGDQGAASPRSEALQVQGALAPVVRQTEQPLPAVQGQQQQEWHECTNMPSIHDLEIHDGLQVQEDRASSAPTSPRGCVGGSRGWSDVSQQEEIWEQQQQQQQACQQLEQQQWEQLLWMEWMMMQSGSPWPMPFAQSSGAQRPSGPTARESQGDRWGTPPLVSDLVAKLKAGEVNVAVEMLKSQPGLDIWQWKKGSEVAQLLLKDMRAWPLEGVALAADQLQGKIQQSATHQFGTYFVQQVVKLFFTKRAEANVRQRASFVAQELRSTCLSVVKNKFGVLVFQRLMEADSAHEDVVALVSIVLGGFSELVEHQYGHFALESILDYGEGEQKRHVVDRLNANSWKIQRDRKGRCRIVKAPE